MSIDNHFDTRMLQGLEPDVRPIIDARPNVTHLFPLDYVTGLAVLSIAISLKRIADSASNMDQNGVAVTTL